jgi:predicted RecA/RadA family phage recombinase
MATNYLHPGKTMPYTAPTGGVTSGGGYIIGGMFVVAAAAADETEEFQGSTEGVWTLAKTTGEGTVVEGRALYWDVTNAKVSVDPTVGHLPIGTAAAEAATGDTTMSVRLNGVSIAGRMLTIRKRFTIAQVNAGATILPALVGMKYRMVDAFAISVGGAAGAVTTVDIIGTLSSSTRKLVAFAQANLTQSALIRAGGTGGTILADGASFTANDAGAAVTVGKTGSDVTTASHIDVHLTYSIE